MIRRVIFEEWQAVITVIAFLITFGAFFYFTLRALTLRKDERERLSQLPLEEEEKSAEKKHE